MDAELATIGIVVLVAACLQGSIGFGLGMLAAPVVALLRPDLMPTTLILLAALTSLYALLRERSSIDGPLFGWAFAGRLPGTALGLLAVTQLPPPALSLALGATVIGGVWLSIHGWTPRVTRVSTATAGALSGLFGTATSIGGLLWPSSPGISTRPRSARRSVPTSQREACSPSRRCGPATPSSPPIFGRPSP